MFICCIRAHLACIAASRLPLGTDAAGPVFGRQFGCGTCPTEARTTCDHITVYKLGIRTAFVIIRSPQGTGEQLILHFFAKHEVRQLWHCDLRGLLHCRHIIDVSGQVLVVNGLRTIISIDSPNERGSGDRKAGTRDPHQLL